jgi:uncharacterized protein YndB with AHSA1/START domain
MSTETNEPSTATASTRIVRHLDAPRSAVYRALLDPRAIETWMVPDGMTSEVHSFEARVGGALRVSLTYDAPDGVGKTSARTDTYHGHVVELVPNERVVEVIEFESTDPALQGAMTVTFTLSDAGTGTELHAVHENLPPGIAPDDNRLGWNLSLDKLSRYLKSR